MDTRDYIRTSFNAFLIFCVAIFISCASQEKKDETAKIGEDTAAEDLAASEEESCQQAIQGGQLKILPAAAIAQNMTNRWRGFILRGFEPVRSYAAIDS